MLQSRDNASDDASEDDPTMQPPFLPFQEVLRSSGSLDAESEQEVVW